MTTLTEPQPAALTILDPELTGRLCDLVADLSWAA